MKLSLHGFLSDTIGYVLVGLLVYGLGWASNEIADLFLSKKQEEKLKKRVKHAIDAIYQAEKSVPGRKRGAEKLVLACKIYMEKTGEKKLEEAERHILSVFPLIKLSK